MSIREAIRASRRTTSFDSQTLGETITLRQFSAADRDEIVADFAAAGQADDAERHRIHQRAAARVVQLMLIENGERAYDELEVLQNEISSDALDEIADRALVFAGLATDDGEPAEKKSSGTRNGDSSSGSA